MRERPVLPRLALIAAATVGGTIGAALLTEVLLGVALLP
jgi:hypothetical protein